MSKLEKEKLTRHIVLCGFGAFAFAIFPPMGIAIFILVVLDVVL